MIELERWLKCAWIRSRRNFKNTLRHSEREIILKKEQKIAVENLMSGNDVLAVIQQVLERVYDIYYIFS